MIGRGTTPTHTFTLPCDSSLIKSMMIIYAQDDVEVFHKDTEDCSFEGNTVKVTLTQSDTLLLDHKRNVQLQLRVLTNDGVAFRSNIETVAVGKILNDEVLE